MGPPRVGNDSLPSNDNPALALLGNYMPLKVADNKRAKDEIPSAKTDFLIHMDDYVWTVHKDLLTSKSDYFRGMLSGFMESEAGVARLPDQNPELVARMVLWCYFGAYPVYEYERLAPKAPTITEVMKEAWTGDAQSYTAPLYWRGKIALHVEMIELADSLMMPQLKASGLQELRRAPYGHIAANREAEVAQALEGLPEELKREVRDFLRKQ